MQHFPDQDFSQQSKRKSKTQGKRECGKQTTEKAEDRSACIFFHTVVFIHASREIERRKGNGTTLNNQGKGCTRTQDFRAAVRISVAPMGRLVLGWWKRSSTLRDLSLAEPQNLEIPKQGSQNANLVLRRKRR